MTTMHDNVTGKRPFSVNFCLNICPIQEKSVISQRFSKTKGYKPSK
jgi:hypothetical protein